DRSVGHRAGGEALDDALDRFDFVDRNRRAIGGELQQAAQRRLPPGLIVDQPRVFLEDLVLPAARRMLELEDRLGVEQVIFTVAAPLVLAAAVEIARRAAARRERRRVALRHFAGDDVDADAADA